MQKVAHTATDECCYAHLSIALRMWCPLLPCCRSGSGRMTYRELRRSDLLDALFALEREEDINRVSRYFRYSWPAQCTLAAQCSVHYAFRSTGQGSAGQRSGAEGPVQVAAQGLHTSQGSAAVRVCTMRFCMFQGQCTPVMPAASAICLLLSTPAQFILCGVVVFAVGPAPRSYEHFYVVYCKFWELDSDHDFSLDKNDLARYNNCALTYQIVERIFAEVRVVALPASAYCASTGLYVGRPRP